MSEEDFTYRSDTVTKVTTKKIDVHMHPKIQNPFIARVPASKPEQVQTETQTNYQDGSQARKIESDAITWAQNSTQVTNFKKSHKYFGKYSKSLASR